MPRNVEKVPNKLPKQITSLSWMFLGATNFNQDISSWNVSNVTDMNHMFAVGKNFNQDISKWDVGKVEKWKNFARSSRFENEPEKWPSKFRDY